jgi:GAF domain-containing protein
MINNSTMEKTGLSETKFSILQEITGSIAATDNINAAATLMLDLALNYTTAEKGSLMLVNDCDELYIFTSRGIDMKMVDTYRERIGEGIAGSVALDRRPLLVRDIEENGRFSKCRRDRYKTKSFISCPIVSKKSLLGVININDKKEGRPFTDDEFALLQIIATQAAVALENAFLMNQLRTKAAELEEMNRRLIDSDVVKTQFLIRISHELRTPLNSMKGAAFYLQRSDKAAGSPQREFLDIISTETNNMIDLVENQLNFIRVEDETQVLRKSVINLPDLVREILNSPLLKTSLAKKNLDVTVDIKGSVSNIVGDRIKLSQLFISLVEELSNYLMHGDSIRISIHEAEHVELNLVFPRRLPDMVLGDLFNSAGMFQTDHPDGRMKLYLARRIAEYHKWDFRAENRGNSFSVVISVPKSAKQKQETFISMVAEVFIEFVSELLDLNICSIMLCDELTGELTIKGARGLDSQLVKRTRLRLGDGIAGRVALEGKPVLIEDIESAPLFGRKSIAQYNTKSLLCLPLKIGDKVIGVMNLNNKKTAEPFTRMDLDVALLLGERISSFMEKIISGYYGEGMIKHSLASFEGLLSAMKKYHKRRSQLPRLVVRIMEILLADKDKRILAFYTSMLYDLGLMVIDQCIMDKEKIFVSDTRILKTHPHATIALLDGFEISEDARMAVLHHHESYDGTGYPDQLKGEEIPLISRVLSVADAFCAMIEDRPYRKAFTKQKALQEIEKRSGLMYDSGVVRALLQALDSAP